MTDEIYIDKETKEIILGNNPHYDGGEDGDEIQLTEREYWMVRELAWKLGWDEPPDVPGQFEFKSKPKTEQMTIRA